MSYEKGSFWFSKLADARKCLRFYEEKHIKGTPVPVNKTGDLEFGTAMHLGINEILLGREGLDVFDMYWDTCKDAEFDRYNHANYKEMAEVFLTRFARLHAKKFKPHMMEERMYTTLGPHKHEGTPDFLGDFEGVPSVVDFKTSGTRYNNLKVVIDTQMPLYAVYAKQALSYEAKQVVYVVFIKSTTAPSIQILKRPLTQSDYNDTIISVVEECDDLVSRKVFPKNPSNCLAYNRECPYLETCFKGVTND
jgi:hypothetical protein